MSLLSYHKSINHELLSVRNRVRDLLYPRKHWGEDGRHKEVALRQVLKRHLPENLRLSSGFVRLNDHSSSQIDLMLTDVKSPVLFKEEDFQIVTPGQVKGIIEVKTKVNLTELRDALEKLSEQVREIRKEKLESRQVGGYLNATTDPWAGLFAFEESNLDPQSAVDMIRDLANQEFLNCIHAICLGPNKFIRFWSMPPDGSNGDPSWHFYELKDLAYSYFIGNAVWREEDGSPDQRHWFPIEGTKEIHCVAKATMLPPYK